ncbi:MAG: YqcC family protein [Succinivibrio sp.]|nr:YqcC family protein [Succinivibrio sp.]
MAVIRREELEQLLCELESQLKRLNLWSETPPAPEALHSQLPFAVDTLKFHQWLQFVLIVKLRALKEPELAAGSVLVHPMAEEVYRGQWGTYRELIALLRRLDALFAA